jgi:hypothetical protein
MLTATKKSNMTYNTAVYRSVEENTWYLVATGYQLFSLGICPYGNTLKNTSKFCEV